MKYTLPKWYDLHAHFRQGVPLQNYISAHIDMGCCGVLAMPNTKPPITQIQGKNTNQYWTIESYLNDLKQAGGDAFDDIIIPLYLTQDTTADMILKGAETGFLRACKYYPPHGTTNSGHAADLKTYINNGVFAAMEEVGCILNIHGEEHGLSGEEYFGKNGNAEDYFYCEQMPVLSQEFPNLKIVCEHITTKTAVDFVHNTNDNIVATITPQHLLYTVSNLLQGLKYHLYCLPLVKFEDDRRALVNAARAKNNTKFFAGTDSAPHTIKATECGCAAGCFTGGIAPQLYADAFDLNDSNFEFFKKFLCLNGAKFYNLPVSNETFSLEKKPSKIDVLQTPEGSITPLHIGLGKDELNWTLTL